MNYTIGNVSRQFGLSRSTLLYYSNIGLLEPSGRSDKGYRLYSERDIKKLGQIMIYREAGVSLKDISRLIHTGEDKIISSLMKRLGEINKEISDLRNMQKVIIRIMEDTDFINDLRMGNLDIKQWMDILDSAGISGDRRGKWHLEFEKQSPQQHHMLLKLLGFKEYQINEQIIKYREMDGEQ